MKRLFEGLLVARLLFPFFNSPLTHLYSDPQRHWDNAARFLHPDIMGSNDPYLYQFWLWMVRWLSHGDSAFVLLASGLLCAAMPWGWYRTLRELLPRHWALGGAIVIALIPESISMYAYFMNETLLMALLGICFWLTLRAHRKGSINAYALACIVWLCAALTRTLAAPMAAGCIATLWLTQAQRPAKLAVTLVAGAALLIPAGLHGRYNLHYLAPFGNLYFNSVYNASAQHDLIVDYGSMGTYRFGSPSFYNPTYYPFSDWLTDRSGSASISIDTRHGRADWQRELARVRDERFFPRWRQRWEDLQYLLFGQNWPNEGTQTWLSSATLWARWLWAPLILFVTIAALRRWFFGTFWLLPVCGLGTFALLIAQSQGVIEARFREPIDAVLVAAALCACYCRRRQAESDSRRFATFVAPRAGSVAVPPAIVDAAPPSPPVTPY